MVAVVEKTQDVAGLTWFYREVEPQSASDASSKPVVVLLHGLPAQSYSWRLIMPELADYGFRAIAPDWPGCGFSDKPDRRDFRYTPDVYCAALEAFLTALDLEQVVIVAQGFLGSVGVQYALRHPDQVKRLAVLNAPIVTSAKLPWKIKQLGVPLLGEMLTQDPILVDRTLEGGGGYVVEDADLDVYRRPFLKSSDVGRSLFATVQNLQLSKVLPEIEAGLTAWPHPLLLAWGDRDPWLPIAAAKAFADTLPNATFEALNEVGHYPQQDWPEKVSAALLPFLRQQAV
ncbi:MAG: alpha/beta fold hydrolase [Kaiparowitsia implicata GSE-PSE-MK54-09C]|nr:alpha/beta fold hydrolase [Kaiparowitsia implicata GSE-PSE-MK54-09C]